MPARLAPTLSPAFSALASCTRGPSVAIALVGNNGSRMPGWNMLRTSGLPAWPPHASTTPRRARMRTTVALLVDVAVLPKALHELAGLGMPARRIARFDAENSAGGRLLAHELVERTVQHELHALLARRELERPRERGAVAERAGSDDAAGVVHLHRRERARALRIGLARVLGRDRAFLHVGLVAEREEAHGSRGRATCRRRSACR